MDIYYATFLYIPHNLKKNKKKTIPCTTIQKFGVTKIFLNKSKEKYVFYLFILNSYFYLARMH